MHFGLLNLIQVLEHIILHRAGQLLHRTVEHVERLGAHPERHAVDVHRCVRAQTATVGAQLLEAKGIRRPNVLLPVQRGIRENQDLAAGTDGRDNRIAVREPLAAGRVCRAFDKVGDVLLIGEPHEHRVLCGVVAYHRLGAKADQVPVWRGDQGVGALGRGAREYCSAGRGARRKVPVIRRAVHQLADHILAVVVELPDAGI